MTHTIYPHEIEEKMLPPPVDELFMVGRATKKKLINAGITTIGQLAKADIDTLKALLHIVHGHTTAILPRSIVFLVYRSIK